MSINVANTNELQANHLALLKNDDQRNYGTLTVDGLSYTVTFPKNDIRVVRKNGDDIDPTAANRSLFFTLFSTVCAFFQHCSFIIRERLFSVSAEQIKARLVEINFQIKNEVSPRPVVMQLELSIPGDGTTPSTKAHLDSLASLTADIGKLTPQSHQPIFGEAPRDEENELILTKFQTAYMSPIERIKKGSLEEITLITAEVSAAKSEQAKGDAAEKVTQFTQRWNAIKNIHGKIQDLSSSYIKLRINLKINSQSEFAKGIIKQRMGALLSLVNSYSKKQLTTETIEMFKQQLQQMEKIADRFNKFDLLNADAELFEVSTQTDQNCYIELIKKPETSLAQLSYIKDHLLKKQAAIVQGALDQTINSESLKKNNLLIQTFLTERASTSNKLKGAMQSLRLDGRAWVDKFKKQPALIADPVRTNREKNEKLLSAHIKSLELMAERLTALEQSNSALLPHEMRFIGDCGNQLNIRMQRIKSLENAINTGVIDPELELRVPTLSSSDHAKKIYLATLDQFQLLENLTSSLPEPHLENNYREQFNQLVNTIVAHTKTLDMNYEEPIQADDSEAVPPLSDTARQDYVIQSLQYQCWLKTGLGFELGE